MSNVKEIRGSLIIRDCDFFVNFEGLENLKIIHGNTIDGLVIRNNDNAQTLKVRAVRKCLNKRADSLLRAIFFLFFELPNLREHTVVFETCLFCSLVLPWRYLRVFKTWSRLGAGESEYSIMNNYALWICLTLPALPRVKLYLAVSSTLRRSPPNALPCNAMSRVPVAHVQVSTCAWQRTSVPCPFEAFLQ